MGVAIMRRAIVLRGVVLTFVRQPIGAPIIDRCGGWLADATRWRGYAVHLTPWRKNEYGDRLGGQAFCIGRVKL